MTKEAPTSVKMKCDLRDEFRVPANERNLPQQAPQSYISNWAFNVAG